MRRYRLHHIGALPGLGGSVVDWIAYGHVKQTVKDSSQFGKGDIRGVLAPESANNAKSDASWIHIVTMTACGVGFITGLSWLMVLNFPGGVLQYYVDLPWPLK